MHLSPFALLFNLYYRNRQVRAHLAAQTAGDTLFLVDDGIKVAPLVHLITHLY